ncbi:TIGR04104 family putative zinc finger protein [Lutispora saccharofermentans]|uniref:CXXC-20-CXXC protein n=1 Tax=Lutispora saccharofermentans TaxID=3024236 RepID=A0ABT1NFA1_9FIRM|nr:TIGR04104 family putative zinc finger protein [Lutispora saccharofermentans]MCQ1529925.1 hypothetical protein [Lutispora saccharofermentans]
MRQKCGKCGTKFRYRSIQKAFWSGEWSGERLFKCESCETEHRLTNYRILYLIFALPLFLIWIPYSNARGIGFIMVILYILSFILLMPFIFKLKMTKAD